MSVLWHFTTVIVWKLPSLSFLLSVPTLTQMSTLAFHLIFFFSFLGVCSLDVFFGQHFCHFTMHLCQLKRPGSFSSILCDKLTILLIILGMDATLPLWICIDQDQNWIRHSRRGLAVALGDVREKKSNVHPMCLNISLFTAALQLCYHLLTHSSSSPQPSFES